VALYQLGDVEPAVPLAPGTGDFQHRELAGNVAE
jgi:hypothetical protein